MSAATQDADRDIEIEALGESAVLVRFGDRVDLALAERAHAFTAALSRFALPGLVDAVPAYASVALFFDLERLPPDTEPLVIADEALAQWLADRRTKPREAASRLVEIPVAYGGANGPDLDALARHAKLDRDEVIARHAGVEYRVGMIGFLPGFPYLIGLDPALQMPRHAQPRARVPARSVGIGGVQTGIYPCECPGGWQLIGRCSGRLFDPRREQPSLLRAGDRVRFRAIAADDLAQARPQVHAHA